MAKRVAVLRKKAKLSQAELGKIVGVGRSTVSMWEAGLAKPRMDKVPKLASALGCSIEDLFS